MAAAAAVLAGAGVSFAADAPVPVQVVVSGTAHQALFAVGFYGKVGIAVGAGGELLESDDQGATWKEVTPAPTQLSLLGVAVHQGHAIAVGQDGLVLTLQQNGHWTQTDSGTKSRLFAVAVNSKGLAVAVGAFGAVIKSDDGGDHWTSVAPTWASFTQGEDPHLYDVKVDEDGGITLVGEFELILRSKDGGKSWQAAHKGDASLFALDIRPDGGGYAVGQSGTVLKTSDHGNTWEALKVDSQAILLGVSSSKDGKVYVTGMHDMLASDDGGKSWRHVAGEEFSSSWYEGTHFPEGASAALAVGHGGRIIRLGG